MGIKDNDILFFFLGNDNDFSQTMFVKYMVNGEHASLRWMHACRNYQDLTDQCFLML